MKMNRIEKVHFVSFLMSGQISDSEIVSTHPTELTPISVLYPHVQRWKQSLSLVFLILDFEYREIRVTMTCIWSLVLK